MEKLHERPPRHYESLVVYGQAFQEVSETLRAVSYGAVARGLCKALMTILNPLSLLLHRVDRDTTTPFNYVAIARKRETEEHE